MYRQFVEALRNQRASDGEILAVLIFLAGLVLFFILRNLWDKKMSQGRQRTNLRRTFLNACRDKGLLPDEIKLLLCQAELNGIEVDSSLVESNVGFDNYVDHVLKNAQTEAIDELNENLTALRGRLGFRPPPRGFALNSTRELQVGQLIYLTLYGNIFLEVRSESVDETQVSVRLQAGMPPVPIGTGLNALIHFNRTGDARYSGECQILKATSDLDGHHLTLSHCNRLRRDQRRHDFRVDDNRTICLWVVDDQLRKARDPFRLLEDRMPERALLEDISGGGASIIFHRNLPPNQGLFMNLDPGAIYGLPIVRGIVIRSGRRMKMDRWAVSIRFEDLRPSEHQKIVCHVFMQERDELKIA